MTARNQGKRTLCIDIGGSGIKSLVVDEHGRPAGKRRRDETPADPTPGAVLEVIEKQAAKQRPYDRVAAGFPGVIKHGAVWTAVNLHPAWIGFPLEAELQKRLERPARLANDAAVQGLGAVSGHGLEMMVTLGTGVGSALYRDGVLVVPLETGHHPFRKGKTYEQILGREGYRKLGRRKWNRNLRKAIANWQGIFNFDRLYLGGGNTAKIDFRLPENACITPNVEGLLGGLGLWRHLNYQRQARLPGDERPKLVAIF